MSALMYSQPKQSVTVRVCGSIGVLEAKYAYSVDARHWLVSPRQAYSYDVKYTGPPGSRLFTRVERPQLGFFGSGSSPTHLYNGVCYATTASSICGSSSRCMLRSALTQMAFGCA